MAFDIYMSYDLKVGMVVKKMLVLLNLTTVWRDFYKEISIICILYGTFTIYTI